MNQKRRFLLALMVALSLVYLPTVTLAASSADQCTSFSELVKKVEAPDPAKPGLLTSINTFIQDTVGSASSSLFKAFTNNTAYQNAVMAAATLMVTILGVAFAIGVMQASFGQLLKRLFVLGVIFTIISPSGWIFFSDTVVRFFSDGTDELIGKVISIGTGIPYAVGDSPFVALDGIASFVISPDMIIAIMGATFSGGPYGGFMGFLLGWCFMGMLKMLIEALRVYAVSYILRALLFGVAPIFIVFLLFEKTKPMFVAWINALVNLSLKPLLYFTFLSFFLVLITSATTDMMGGNELCWTQYQHVQGSPNLSAGWRFRGSLDKAGEVGERSWNGLMSCVVSGPGGSCPEFPINILDLLSFVILVTVAMKFASVVDNIANEISNSFVGVGQQARMDIFGGKGGGGGSTPMNTNKGGDRGTRGGW